MNKRIVKIISLLIVFLLVILYINAISSKREINIQIKNSYLIWDCSQMRKILDENNCEILNRTYFSLYVEWWLHNIGYYITAPFECLKDINDRCKDVDLGKF
jgi:hypothetical protein